jgi:hypothetical protein
VLRQQKTLEYGAWIRSCYYSNVPFSDLDH